MDKTKAREILDGGSTNALKSTGTLIEDPYVVIQLIVNGTEHHTTFGSFDIAGDLLDYAVHRAKGVTLSEQTTYYQTNRVEDDVYTLTDDGDVEVQRFKATEDNWEKTTQ